MRSREPINVVAGESLILGKPEQARNLLEAETQGTSPRYKAQAVYVGVRVVPVASFGAGGGL